MCGGGQDPNLRLHQQGCPRSHNKHLGTPCDGSRTNLVYIGPGPLFQLARYSESSGHTTNLPQPTRLGRRHVSHFLPVKGTGLHEWNNWHMQLWGFPLSRNNAYFGESGPCSMVLQSVSVVQEAGWTRVIPRCYLPSENEQTRQIRVRNPST